MPEELTDKCKLRIATGMSVIGDELLEHFPKHEIMDAYMEFSDKIKNLIVTPEEQEELENFLTALEQTWQKRRNAPNN